MWKCSDLLATVDAIMPKHWCAACRYPDAGQGIGIHLIELDQALTFLVLQISTKLSEICASDE